MLLRRHKRITPKQNVVGTKPPVTKKGISLEEYTVSELRDMARDRKISGYSTLNKAELIKAIE